MRRLRLLISAALILVAAPAAAQPVRVWAIALPRTGDAVLRYAFLNSDDLMLGYTCAKGTGQVIVVAATPVRLTEPVDPDAPQGGEPVVVSRPATITVASGTASATLPGRVTPDRVHGGSTIVTEISSSSPVIAAFRRTAVLRVSVLRDVVEAPPVPGGMLRAFLGFCR